jgi:hypothetical protein
MAAFPSALNADHSMNGSVKPPDGRRASMPASIEYAASVASVAASAATTQSS